MKKILLATTLLAGTAGFAAAEGHITFSGSAAAGIGSHLGGAFETYSNAGLDVTFSGTTDGGLEFGATFGGTVGRTFNIDDGFADETGAPGMPSVYISGSFGTITFSDDNMDFYDDANGGGDVKYENTFGSVSLGLIADVDSGDMSVSADADLSGLALHADTDTYGETNVSVGYTMGALSATVGIDQDSAWYVEGSYVAGSVTVGATYNNDATWSASVDYAANGLSVGVSTDDASAWALSAGYDLGGGLSLEAGVNASDSAFVGAAMSF